MILDNVFEFGGALAAKVIPPWVDPGCLVGSLAPGEVQLVRSGWI